MTDLNDSNNYGSGIKSWEEFYESYDGKFDERHMLHITIHAHYKKEVENLGYKQQHEEDDWHKPDEGEYKFDDEGNLVIIHSCPDRDIFQMNAKDFLEELCFNYEWVSEATFSIM